MFIYSIPHKIAEEFKRFKEEENTNSIGFIETKQNIYFIRFDIIEDFKLFAEEVSEKETFLCSYCNCDIKTVDKKMFIKYRDSVKIALKEFENQNIFNKIYFAIKYIFCYKPKFVKDIDALNYQINGIC